MRCVGEFGSLVPPIFRVSYYARSFVKGSRQGVVKIVRIYVLKYELDLLKSIRNLDSFFCSPVATGI